MPRGGAKPGERRGGRKKGVPNRASAAKVAAIEASGLTPLDYLLSVLRDTILPRDARIEAAKAAAPYVHPKLANIELTGKDGGPIGVNVVRYSDPAQPVDAQALPNAGVAGARTGLPPRRSALAS